MVFTCKIATPSGEVLSQTQTANSAAELRQRLSSQGYYIFSIHPRLGLNTDFFRPRRKKISVDEFLIFNQQFLTLSKSGLPLQKSLELLSQQARSEELRAALGGISAHIGAGKLLSEAFEEDGRFPKIYSATLRAGERSGNLDKVLSHYLAYQKTTRGFRKKFIAAMIYPAFLIVFLIILITFVITFIVPKFALLYQDLEVQLPPLTAFVIALSHQVNHYIIFILAGMVGAFFAVRTAFRSPKAKLGWERFKFRLPLVGTLLLKFSVAEFARTLSTLLMGGLPIVPSLETARDSVSSPLVAGAIRDAGKQVTSGHSLSSGLRLGGFFPDTALDMIEVGESTGALPVMLESIAEFYEEDVNIDLATLVSLVDPVMLAIIAVFVCFILVAFYLPLFSLAAQVH